MAMIFSLKNLSGIFLIIFGERIVTNSSQIKDKDSVDIKSITVNSENGSPENRKTTEKFHFSVVSSISLFKRLCDDALRNQLNQDRPRASRMSLVLVQVMLAAQLHIAHQKR